jgi:hypothetical protein
MNKKLLIIGLVLMLSMITFVSADLTTDLVSYWKFDETTGTTAEDSHSTNDLTHSNTNIISSSGLINYGLFPNNLYNTKDTTFNFGNTHTINFWVYPTSLTNGVIMAEKTAGYFGFYIIESSLLNIEIYDDSFKSVNITPTLNQWNMITVSFDTSSIKFYKNEELISSKSFNGLNVNSEGFVFGGNRQENAYVSNMKLDELGIWSRALTSDEVIELYKSGNGNQYPFTSSLSTPEISGNTITINDTSYYNGIINISSKYFNFENIICEYTLNNGIDWFSADNNSTHCYKNSLEPTGNLTIQFRAQENGEGDYIESDIIEAVYVSSLDRSYLFSQGITDSVLSLTIQDALNSTLLSGISGTISNGYTSIEINSSEQEINLLTELNYTINIGASHYATFNLENYYMENSTQSYTARLYPNPSIIDIQIKDGSTGSLITESVNVQVISDTIIKSVTTTNGTAYFDDLSPNYYMLRFISANYTTSDYQQLVTFDYYHNIVVYLFPEATSLVTFTTRNEITGVPIEDVIYTISTSVNDTLVSIGSKFTDLSGQVTFSYEEDKIYYFSVSKSGFESKSFQLGPVLNANYNVWLNQIAQYNLTEALLGINLDYYINSYLSSNGITLLSGRFEENTNNTFKMVIASPNGELISYGYNLTYESTTISGSDTNSYGSTLTGTLEIGDADILDKVTLTYYYTSGVTGYHIFTEEFYIGQVPNAGLISNLKNEHYGLGMLERVLIVIIVAGIFGGLIGLFSGLLAGGVSIMFIFGYFLYSGFIEVYFVALPIFLLFMFLIRGGDS